MHTRNDDCIWNKINPEKIMIKTMLIVDRFLKNVVLYEIVLYVTQSHINNSLLLN